MDITPIVENLNEPQREAVCAPDGNLLILAGAGCGKTRVLVHRIAWLIEAQGVSPYSILAVTFTNKAAREMRTRIEELLGTATGGMWVGTFHGLAHRLLRNHWSEAGLPRDFQILDSDDQYRLIRRLLREMELDESSWQPKQIQWFINGNKDEGLRPGSVEHYNDPYKEQLVRVYQHYEEACQRGGMVDFAELLLRAHELWLKQPQLLEHYRGRFSNLLVDEFQDTNAIQYAWIRLLAGDSGSVCVVGDDDQSIYGWRGAKAENIQRFRKDYRDVSLIRLEQNYRSTSTILAAANALIDNNSNRLGKELWTEGERGEAIKLYRAYNELDEARFVAERIELWCEEGENRSDVAILYRSNAQSRVLEEMLLRASIPYRIYGGLRFFERAEIKDALAYLRLVANRGDDPSFERVVNTPTRGIGGRSVELIRVHARNHNTPMFQAACELVEQGELSARARNAIAAFIGIIDTMETDTAALALRETAQRVIEASGLIEHFRKEKGEKGLARIENLEELVNAARQFEFGDDEELEGLSPLNAFLSHAALESGDTQADEGADSVQMMTLHSAKGLEFPLVFLCGLEEGLFPHRRSVEEPQRLEEERRLCYVGMTRAMRQLYIAYAEVRRLYGSENYTRPSRFIDEIPSEYLEEIRIGGVITPAQGHSPSGSTDGISIGQHIVHPTFGPGVVLQCEGAGAQTRVEINFEQVGLKWVMPAYTELRPLG